MLRKPVPHRHGTVACGWSVRNKGRHVFPKSGRLGRRTVYPVRPGSGAHRVLRSGNAKRWRGAAGQNKIEAVAWLRTGRCTRTANKLFSSLEPVRNKVGNKIPYTRLWQLPANKCAFGKFAAGRYPELNRV